MKMKQLQIVLVVTVVLCAAGVFSGIGRSPAMDGEGFDAPLWLEALDFLSSSPPQLSATEVVPVSWWNRGSSGEYELSLNKGVRSLTIVRSKEKVRQARFKFISGSPSKVTITYADQDWLPKSGDEPEFFIYSKGGSVTFTNSATPPIKIRLLED